MKNCCITFLLVMSFCSCIPKQEHDRVLKVKKDIKVIMQTNEILMQELKQLNFKIKNIEFSLQMCEIKLRKQDKKLIECLNLRGCK